jgi:hypothetical protein
MNGNILKITLGLRIFPDLNATNRAKKLNIALRTYYKYCDFATVYCEDLLKLLTPDQICILSGTELSILQYLLTADLSKNNTYHCMNCVITDNTFRLATQKFKEMGIFKLPERVIAPPKQAKRVKSVIKRTVKNCENCHWRFGNNCAVKYPGAVTCVKKTDKCLKWESIKIGLPHDENSASFGNVYTDGIDFTNSIGGYEN